MLVFVSFVQLAHETAGAARTRSSLRPLNSEGRNEIAKPGRIVPREGGGVCHTLRRHSGARAARATMCNCTSENPYSRSWLWIPGLRQVAHPGMTGEIAVAMTALETAGWRGSNRVFPVPSSCHTGYPLA